MTEEVIHNGDEVLRILKDAGVHLRMNGDALQYRADGEIGDELRGMIREHEAGVMAYILGDNSNPTGDSDTPVALKLSEADRAAIAFNRSEPTQNAISAVQSRHGLHTAFIAPRRRQTLSDRGS